MSIKLPVLDYLDEHDILYELKEFPPQEADLKAIAAKLGVTPRHLTKTVVYEGESTELYICIVGSDQKVNLQLLTKASGETALAVADEEQIKTNFGADMETFSAIGLKRTSKVFIDESLRDLDSVGVASGQRGSLLFLQPQTLEAATSGKYIKLASDYEETDWASLRLADEFLPTISLASELKPSIPLSKVGEYVGKEVVINGWVYNKRSSGKIMFLQVRSDSNNIQAVIERSSVSDAIWAMAEDVSLESSVQVQGVVKEDKRSPFGFELQLTGLKIIQKSPAYPIGKKDHGPDFLLDHRHLWLRSEKQRAALIIRDEVVFSMISFLREQGFLRIDTPIFQQVSCEDTSELFEVNYFGEKAYLTQSGQLYCEAAELALGKTYDFGPVFRAEKSKTRKHLIEFWMMDAELPFTDLAGLMDFEEKLIKRVIADCLKHCPRQLQTLERDTTVLAKYTNSPFVRVKHKDVIDMLNSKFGMKLTYVDDIGAPEEAKLSEIYDVPVFVTDWPAEIKAFYMPRYQDGNMQRVRSVDLMSPESYGEICGGAEREFNFNKLLDVLQEKKYPYQDYAWYMDLRKYGSVPHSGFGVGIERLVRWVGGIKHIRETIPFPRMLNRLYP